KIPIVISAGNGGPRMLSIGSPGAAKHAITVGATNAFGDLCKYSSRGPTLDGRFKPDLVAPGSFVLDEFLLEGTSCSAPWVTAIAGIMHKILRSAIAVRRILHLSAKALPLKYETEKLVFARKREKKYLDRLIKSFGNVWALIFDPRNFYGGGVLDAYAALMLTRELLSEIKMAGDAEAS
ncbi:MAG: S8 family serine peptidase, partial [Nitrososphaerota archaeon]